MGRGRIATTLGALALILPSMPAAAWSFGTSGEGALAIARLEVAPGRGISLLCANVARFEDAFPDAGPHFRSLYGPGGFLISLDRSFWGDDLPLTAVPTDNARRLVFEIDGATVPLDMQDNAETEQFQVRVGSGSPLVAALRNGRRLTVWDTGRLRADVPLAGSASAIDRARRHCAV